MVVSSVDSAREGISLRARGAERTDLPMQPEFITPKPFRRSMRVYFGNCEECGRLYSKRNEPSRRFCSRACVHKHHGRVYRGANHPTFKGRVAHTGGYIRVWFPGHPLASRDGYVLEHRLILYRAGVEIPDGHYVHHKNGDKTDNHLENLEIMEPSGHSKHHVAAAGQVINQYGAWPLRACTPIAGRTSGRTGATRK